MPPPARRLARRTVGWALLADSVPLYPLYALLFADTGLSDAQISALFAIWGTVGLLAEVPSGALADRFSRRGALVVAGLLQAAGFAVWVTWPGFTGFAAGFVLWGLGGALVSGAQEALLYDGLVAAGAQAHYAQVQGRVTAMGLVAQVPAAVAATALYSVGGYPLVGWVSVGVSLGAAALAARLPEPARTPEDYFETLTAGVRVAAAHPVLRAAVLAAAVVGGFDAVDEYFPILARDAAVPVELVPAAMLVIAVAGAVGAVAGGAAGRLPPWALGVVFGVSLLLFGLATYSLLFVAVSYALYRAVLVVVDVRLQERIDSSARATVTSVAGVGVETAGLALFGVWAFGGLTATVAVWLLAALALPWWLRR